MIVLGPRCSLQRGDGMLWLEKIVNSMVLLPYQLKLWQVDGAVTPHMIFPTNFTFNSSTTDDKLWVKS